MRARIFVTTIITASTLLLVGAVFSPVSAGEVEILFTACSNGVMENCKCPSDPLGAMEKRSSEIERRRKLGDVLLLDSGDFMPPLHDTLAAPYITEAMRLQEYDAIGLGDQEIIQGAQMMEMMTSRLPIVCANLVEAEGGELIAPNAYKIIERDGQTFFITALVHPLTLKYMAPSLINYSRVLNPDSVLVEVLKHAPDDAKVIVLSHAGEEQDRQNADTWASVDLIIGGHSQSIFENAIDKSGDIPVGQCGGNSRYLGVAQFKGKRVRGDLVEIKPELPDDQRILDQVMRLKAERRVFRDSYTH